MSLLPTFAGTAIPIGRPAAAIDKRSEIRGKDCPEYPLR